jgi:hypothetical protein
MPLRYPFRREFRHFQSCSRYSAILFVIVTIISLSLHLIRYSCGRFVIPTCVSLFGDSFRYPYVGFVIPTFAALFRQSFRYSGVGFVIPEFVSLCAIALNGSGSSTMRVLSYSAGKRGSALDRIKLVFGRADAIEYADQYATHVQRSAATRVS